MEKNPKAYTFACILYKDSLTYDYNKIIDYISSNYTDYAYIEHKPEKDETKEHTHLLIHFPNKRYLRAFANEIGVADNYIEKANLIPYLRYLIHFDDEEKIQYSIDQVHGPLKEKLIEILNGSSLNETEQVSMIFDYIMEQENYVTMTSVIQFVIQNGIYSAYRRNYSMFRDLIVEHNKFI